MTEARDVLLGPIEARGATEQIVRRLGEAIGSGVLKPGERLPRESDLARMLDVAPMTLRQALAVLRDAGYITTSRGRTGGSFVSERPLDQAPLLSDDELPTTQELRDHPTGAARSRARRRPWRPRGAVPRRAEPRTRRPKRRAAPAIPTTIGWPTAPSTWPSPRCSQSVDSSPQRLGIQIELSEMRRSIPRPKVALAESHKQHIPLLQAIYEGDSATARLLAIGHVEATYDWLLGLRLGRFRSSDSPVCPRAMPPPLGSERRRDGEEGDGAGSPSTRTSARATASAASRLTTSSGWMTTAPVAYVATSTRAGAPTSSAPPTSAPCRRSRSSRAGMSGVVIVGAGLGGLRAAESLRAPGTPVPITVVGDEPHLPYNRPPLSKEALRGGVDVPRPGVPAQGDASTTSPGARLPAVLQRSRGAHRHARDGRPRLRRTRGRVGHPTPAPAHPRTRRSAATSCARRPMRTPCGRA